MQHLKANTTTPAPVNRTNVELKWKIAKQKIGGSKAVNRTNVELKLLLPSYTSPD